MQLLFTNGVSITKVTQYRHAMTGWYWLQM